jgi:hypothetical protein
VDVGDDEKRESEAPASDGGNGMMAFEAEKIDFC